MEPNPDPSHAGASRAPAVHLLVTKRTWEDLVLPADTARGVAELLARLESDASASRVRALFTGPAGTGKTLTAALLGKRSARSTWHVDLERLTATAGFDSLEVLFAGAGEEGAILLFDEADALFGERTDVADSHDRYTDQEVSYLLGRIAEYDGPVITAARRPGDGPARAALCRTHIVFSAPGPREREALWRRALGAHFHDPVGLAALAAEHALTGADVARVVRRARARLALQGRAVTCADLERVVAELGS